MSRPILPVPEYRRFLTVDEVSHRAGALAARVPEHVRLVDVGRSTDDEPIRMLRIGHGDEQLLFIGCPHPNEPIGMLTIDRLAERLVSDTELRGDSS